MSNAVDKYKIITFSIANNAYLCHPYMFITENYSSKLTIMSLWAPTPKSSAESSIPKKSVDTSLIRYVLEIIHFTNCHTWLFSNKYIHKRNFLVSSIHEAI